MAAYGTDPELAPLPSRLARRLPATAPESTESRGPLIRNEDVMREPSRHTLASIRDLGKKPRETSLARILVVDDEPDILELVRYNLSSEGFEVDTAVDGRDALDQLNRRKPDLVVLDLMLPDQSGTEVCQKIRASPAFRDLPVIMLTARSEELDRVLGFELGADDYVTKPFSTRELTLRVKAVLKRNTPLDHSNETLEHGALKLDPVAHRCAMDNEEIRLTGKEFNILATLMRRSGQVVTRQKLLDEVWGEDVAVTHRTVDTHLKRLREKLGAAGGLIHTVRGLGYRFPD